MKRVGVSILLRRLPDPAPQHFEIVSVRKEFIPQTLSEIPFNSLSLDGSAETAVTINSSVTSVILRE